MAYLGNTPASRFTSMDKQTITGDGGTDYTLDHAVGNEQEIEVFVNNVRQEPSVAYTVVGTDLTMTGNVASTDDFYVVFQGKAQQSVTHPSSSALQATTGTFSSNVDVGGSLLVDTIKEGTGTNTAMTIDSNGRVDMDASYVFDQWYLNANHTTDGDSDITAWSQVAWTGTGRISGMSHSSGVFTFPQTGLYKVSGQFVHHSDAGDNFDLLIKVTTNNNNYITVLGIYSGDSDSRNGGAYGSVFVNVTDVSNVKAKFTVMSMNASSYVLGNSSLTTTNVMFERVAPAQ